MLAIIFFNSYLFLKRQTKTFSEDTIVLLQNFLLELFSFSCKKLLIGIVILFLQ